MEDILTVEFGSALSGESELVLSDLDVSENSVGCAFSTESSWEGKLVCSDLEISEIFGFVFSSKSVSYWDLYQVLDSFRLSSESSTATAVAVATLDSIKALFAGMLLP